MWQIVGVDGKNLLQRPMATKHEALGEAKRLDIKIEQMER